MQVSFRHSLQKEFKTNHTLAAQEGKRLVVIGSSFISMELVVAVSKRKLASIDIIGMDDVPFENILGKEIGAGLKKVSELFVWRWGWRADIHLRRQYHESQGIKFHMNSKVDKIVPKEGQPNVVGGVVVNGVTLPADFVIMGVGVAPATEFLKGSGLDLEQDGGIKVDEYLRVKSGPDRENVYAIGKYRPLTLLDVYQHHLLGDIAIFPQVHGGEARIEHWNVRSCTYEHCGLCH